MIVFARKGACLICNLPDQTRDAIGRAMWDAKGHRAPHYVADALAAGAARGETFSKSAIANHAKHVDQSRRRASVANPADSHELPLHADFQTFTQRAAALGMRALDAADADLLEMDSKDILEVAKLGLRAVSAQEASRLKGNDQKLTFAAIFGLSSGHLDMPLDDTGDELTLDDLRAEVESERFLLVSGE